MDAYSQASKPGQQPHLGTLIAANRCGYPVCALRIAQPTTLRPSRECCNTKHHSPHSSVCQHFVAVRAFNSARRRDGAAGVSAGLCGVQATSGAQVQLWQCIEEWKQVAGEQHTTLRARWCACVRTSSRGRYPRKTGRHQPGGARINPVTV